jgi:pantothenate synthetase
MSSRNELLKPIDREHAGWIFKILSELAQNWKTKPFAELLDNARKAFTHTQMELEYLEISDAMSLTPLSDYSGVHAVACVAVRIGGVRLIDNIELPA